MGRLTAILGALAAVGIAESAVAQGPRLPPPYETQRLVLQPTYASAGGEFSYSHANVPPVTLLGDRDATPRTHWLLGGAVGAAVFGVGGALYARGLGADDPNIGGVVLGGVVGGALGFIVGSLIGGQFPKSP